MAKKPKSKITPNIPDEKNARKQFSWKFNVDNVQMKMLYTDNGLAEFVCLIMSELLKYIYFVGKNSGKEKKIDGFKFRFTDDNTIYKIFLDE